MHYGLQAGFGQPLGREVTDLVRRCRFGLVRLDAQLADAATLPVLVREAVAAGLRPLTIIRPEQIGDVPAGTDVEFYNEPDLNGPTPKDYIERVWAVIAQARAASLTVWAGVVSNLNTRGLDYLAALVPQLPEDVGISVHRYPERGGDPEAPHAGFESRQAEVDRLKALIGTRRWGVSEFGYHTAAESAAWWQPKRALTDDQVASRVEWEWAFWAAQGAAFAVLYQLNDGPSDERLDRYGIRRMDGTLKPVADTVPAPVITPEPEPVPEPTPTATAATHAQAVIDGFRLYADELERDPDPGFAGLVWAMANGMPVDEARAILSASPEWAALHAEPGFPVWPDVPEIGLSYYTSLTDPRIDVREFATRLADAGAVTTRVWLIDAWAVGPNGTGQYAGFLPWPRQFGMFDLFGVEPAYFERLRAYVEAMNHAGITPTLTGWELYAWSRRKAGMLWVPDAAVGPFRRNIQGLVYEDDAAFDVIGLDVNSHAFLGVFYGRVVAALQGLDYRVELGNEMPEKPLHERLRALWRRAGFGGVIQVNRQEDTPGQYANMRIGADYDRIAFHGRRDLSYLDEVFPQEPVHQTFRAFLEGDTHDPARIVFSSDGCRKSTNPDDAYDYDALAGVFRDALARGCAIEHQSALKLRAFAEGRIDLNDLETDWLLSLRR